MLNHLTDLLAHAEWADAVFFHAWGNSPARENDELRRRVTHIVDVQEAFRSALSGGPFVPPRDAAPEGYDFLRTRAAAAHRSLREFVGSLDVQALEKTVRIPWFLDPPCIITVADGLVQVAMHTQHHRGQLMTRLKDLGGEPKNVDWIIWLWRQKPVGRWS